MKSSLTRRNLLAGGAAAGLCALAPKRGLGAAAEERRLRIDPEAAIATIRPELHGNFAEHLGSCIYGGLWVGKNSKIPNVNGYRKEAVDYLRALGIPVLRWPGGCFADSYHWRQGIGPAEKRPKLVNGSWGGYVEDNSFGTHEFVGLCRLIGSEPYFSANVGSGTPREFQEWIEYCNYPAGSTLSDERVANGSPEPFRIKYWGVGNENWGCGGGMRPDEYSQQYRQFATFARAYGGTTPYLVACGPSSNDKDWTSTFFKLLGRRAPNGYSMHYYQRGSLPATKFTPEAMQLQFQGFARLEQAIVEQRALMNTFDPKGNTGLIVDEWGVWDQMVPEEQREVRPSVAADHHALRGGGGPGPERVPPPGRQGGDGQYRPGGQRAAFLLLTHEDKCIRTPAYYAFELLKPHRSKTSLKVVNPDDGAPNGLSVSASRQGNDLVITLVNPRHDTPINGKLPVAGKGATRLPPARCTMRI